MVYGGGRAGLMGHVADAILEVGNGTQVTGIITRQLMDKELGHRGIHDLRIVDTMHERKKMMADIARGFVALPGGVGTLDELFEILAWAQLWAAKVNEGALRQLLPVDGHPPGVYRMAAPSQHEPAYYEAFGIRAGDRMWLAPGDRVTIW